jgi:hypothetical protein
MCSESIPIIATLIVAVVCTADILFSDLGPGYDPQGNGSARMITAAAVARADAIKIPSQRPVGVLSTVTIA